MWARQFCRKQSILELNLDRVALLSFMSWSKIPDLKEKLKIFQGISFPYCSLISLLPLKKH